MSGIVVVGAGAFGTVLAVALAQRRHVTLWARDDKAAERIASSRESPRLPGVRLPDDVAVSADPVALASGILLLALPAQALLGFLAEHARTMQDASIVACGKGIDLATLEGPTALIRAALPSSRPALLTGPSFTADIARFLPTALTLACADAGEGERLQAALSTQALRLYRTTDVVGAELGGALKNVVAIACGVCVGAGLGSSARAALLTRGFAEMVRVALRVGAKAETLHGLSGLGDLMLTATSEQSRNLRHGLALGRGDRPAEGVTVEGVATAIAALALGRRMGLDLPVTAAVAALVEGRLTAAEVMRALLDRPLRAE